MSDGLTADDVHGFGMKIAREGKKIVINKKDTYAPIADARPAPCPAKWQGLIGEYGPDFNVVVILEKDGQLYTQIEWGFLYPLKEISETFSSSRLRHVYGRQDYFHARQVGQCDVYRLCEHAVQASAVAEARRDVQIEPVRPVDELRKVALAAKPPQEKNAFFRKPELVDLTTLDKSVKLDIRYATTNNFLGTPFYTSARAFMQKPAANALVKAHKELAKQGYGLLIHDAYRPGT